MTLTVLSDAEVREILLNLTREDVRAMQHRLADTLHEYSTGTQDSTVGCSANQPHRVAIHSGGRTTLYMPAQTGLSAGVKVVSLKTVEEPKGSAAAKGQLEGQRSNSPSSTARRTASQGGADSPQRKESTASGISGTNLAIRPSNASTAADSSASTRSGSTMGSVPSIGPSIASSQSTTPRGTLTLLHPSGSPLAFMGAEELTAFRTALAATLLITRRTRVHSIAVFGAGKQAYWHIRLALLLRGEDIHHVRIINRSFAGAEPLLREVYGSDGGWPALRHGKLDFSVLGAEFGEYPRLLKQQVRDADAIFCCTPSEKPLFPAEFLTSSEGRRKGRYVSMIGSYRPHMLELHPDVLRQAVGALHHHADGSLHGDDEHQASGSHRHFHRHAETSGVVIVDGLEACMREAGEIIQAKLRPDQLVEIGELIMVKRAAMREVELGLGKGEEGLKRWLEAGNVLYKSVGLGVMDLAVGEEIVRLAEERGVGTRVEGF